ncbi:MAG: ROK family protein [Solirubrobacterales bacterium]
MSRPLIGVDVGGTKISVASLSEAGLEGPRIMPTAAAGGQALIDEIVQAVEFARTLDPAAVGVGVPSVVEFTTGRVKSTVNIELADVPLRTVLQERLDLPVFVDNDANCAALAEAHEGARMVSRDLVMFTLGTGVGGGIVMGGRIYRGATGGAGEFGHTLIGLDLEHGAPAAESFPQPGSLESLASGRALDALGAALAREQPQSALGREAAEHPVHGAAVVAAAQQGDEHACALIKLLGERLGVGIANAINVFDPELVVIGGGVATAGDMLLGPARETARRFVVPGVGESTEIRLARHGPNAGVLGAALLARHELEAQVSQAARVGS